MTKEESKTGKGLLYVLIGGGIGAVLALLFAPKTGKQFRGEIGDAARKSLDKTEEIAAELSEKAQTVYQDTKSKAGEFYDSAMQKIGSATASIKEMTGELPDAAGNKGGQIAAHAADGKKESDREDKAINPLPKEAKDEQNL